MRKLAMNVRAVFDYLKMSKNSTGMAYSWVEQISRATDSFGLVDRQEFTLSVSAQTNRAPVITSTPVYNVNEGSSYDYDVAAYDPDGDVLSYSLIQSPAGMSISIITGEIHWQAMAPEQLGGHPITVRVQDLVGAYTTQNYTLNVIGRQNVAPVITSSPVLVAQVGQLYHYDVDANDADGDIITYSLLDAPEGFSINPENGLIAGLAAEVGAVNVTVAADDGRESDQQLYTLVIQPLNEAPQFTSTPLTVVNENSVYHYAAEATDPNGDVLTYKSDFGLIF